MLREFESHRFRHFVLGSMKKIWTLWAKALGEKSFPCNNDADKVALIRTAIVLFYITTNLFIIAGVIRHW
jgi:hypothetical protein